MARATKPDDQKTGRRKRGRVINLGGDKLYFVPNDTDLAQAINGLLNPKTLMPFKIDRDELISLTEEELEALLNDSTSLRPARK
jgi:hypothetical protein